MELRPTGIDVIGDVPWGTHFCQFYDTKQDLADILVPYFKAGLESRELCLWVTAPPLEAPEAWDLLARAVPDLGFYREQGLIEILPCTEWYLLGGSFDPERVLRGWGEKLEGARSRGCAGLRLSGNTSWLEKAGWRNFTEYEAAVDLVIGQHPMLALCTYSLDRCGGAEVADVIKNHAFSLFKREGRWQRFESFERRRLAEAHAREVSLERERLSITLQSIGDGVIATDAAGRVVMLNGVAAELTGWSQAEAVGRPFGEVVTIVDARTDAPCADPVRQVLATGTVATLASDTTLVARDGTRRAVADSAAPIRDRSGETVGVVLVFRDVSATRLAEEAVRESEERYRLLFSNLSQGFAVHEMLFDQAGRPCDYRFLEINPAFERLTGLTREQAVGRTVRELLPGIEQSWIDRYGAVAATGVPAHFDSFTETLGRHYEVLAFRPSAGRFATLFFDVTERKRTEQRLAESQADLNRAQAVAQTGSWRLDVRRNSLLWSDETHRLFGIPAGTKLTYETFLATIHPDDRQRVDRCWAAALRGEPYDVEHRLRAENGVKWVREKAQLEFDPDGFLLGGFGTVQDITQRKQNEAALEEQKEWFRVTLSSIGDAVIVTDPEGAVAFMNPVAEELTGWLAASALGQPLAEVFHIVNEETGVPAANPVARVIESGKVEGLANHTVLVGRDGSRRPIDDSAAPIRGPEGDIRGVVLIFRDITERKRSEQALSASERLYRAIGESIDYGVWVCAPDGRNTYASESFLKLVGITQQQCSGFGWGDVLHPDDAERTIAQWKECVRSGGTWDIEHRFRGPDGEYHPALARGVPVKNEKGEVICWAGINLDISRLKRTEAELRDALAEADEARRTLAALMEHVPEGITLADAPDATIRMVSRFGQELLGRAHSNLTAEQVAQQWTVFEADGKTPMAPEDLPLVRAIRGGETVRDREIVQTTTAGQRLSLLCNAAPIRDARGELVGGIVAWRDITGRKQLEEERERHLAQIEEANEAKDLFFNTLSHELRTPLAAMLNSVEVLKNPLASKAQQTRVTSLLERNVRHQTRLVDDLLDLSRIMRKKVELARAPLDLREVVASQVEVIEPGARKGRLALSVAAPERPVPVLGDGVRLGQVVSNLLHNALKFTEPGGAVTVTVSVDGKDAVVRVEDTGIGIEPELLPHVFEAFRQAETSLARSKGGLGIGLAVSRSLAELHGGTLGGSSGGVGRGSAFTLRLPLRLEPASAPADAAGSAGDTRKLRVLVVEDGVDLLESMTLLLKLMGHAVLAAGDGATAIEVVRRERPDVALVDIGLPDMDGYAVARVLRSDPSSKDTKLIALTGYATPEHRERALAAGFDRHLAKPVDADDLQRALDGQRPPPNSGPGLT